MHAVVLGVGKKAFDGGEVPRNVTLAEVPAAGPNGIVYLRYSVASGVRATRDMTAPGRGVGRDD